MQKKPRLAFYRQTAGLPPRLDIAVSDGRGRDIRVLTGDSRPRRVQLAVADLAWSPDGRRIAFTAAPRKRVRRRAGFFTRLLARLIASELAQVSADIYVMDADGSGTKRLTRTKDASSPIWSPDGRTIVYARRGELTRVPVPSSLWSMRADGSGERALTVHRQNAAEIPTSFSPDGRELGFTRERFPPAGELPENVPSVVVLELDTRRERRLADRSQEPAFSPDGRRIAFVSTRDENGIISIEDLPYPANELYVMRADGTRQRRLTRTKSVDEGSPTWLPDGTRIAYQRAKQKGDFASYAVMQINRDGSCPTSLLAAGGLDADYVFPAWRPGKARRGSGRLRC